MGPGDDAAVLHNGMVITTDSLVETVHWDARLTSEDVGWKSIAVSVSDLAAMGARPEWTTCSLSIPSPADSSWIRGFANGLQAACHAFSVALVGGDTTRSPGPRFVNVTMGGVAPCKAVSRNGADVGEDIWVTGIPGLAAAGYVLNAPFKSALKALRRPVPPLQFALDMATHGLVRAMMDLSDGLASDLPKLCTASGIGAILEPSSFPSHPELDSLSERDTLRFAGGDDFQLLFTAPKEARKELIALANLHQILVSRIGFTTVEQNVIIRDQTWPQAPWSHFANSEAPH